MFRLIAALGSVTLLASRIPLTIGAEPASVTLVELPGKTLARLEPEQGTYFGVNLDWGADSPEAFNRRLTRPAAVYVQFVHFPLRASDVTQLDDAIAQIAAVGGLALITLEPFDGLEAVTPDTVDTLATHLARYNTRQGVPILVRFAHEMNGSWYPWGQRPTQYIEKFRLVAETVHRRTPQTAMVWAPNYGAGYPFPSGQYRAFPGSPDFLALDTNGDGALDDRDDMYAPYYPGDDAVDWVGMSLYHWGDRWPWGKNIIPEADKFIAQLTGTYVGPNGDERPVPDFYQTYAVQRGKPLAIAETAALYNTTTQGDAEALIKRGWWQQVFNDQVARDYPQIKMINWFEWRKYEAEVSAVVDWTITREPELAQLFVSDLPRERYLFASDLHPWRVYLPLIRRS